MNSDASLVAEVYEFAANITRTIQAVLGSEDVALRAVVLDDLVVVSTEGTGIRLLCDSLPVFDLRATFQCGWDSSGGFIAVHRSEFHVFVVDEGEPIVRFEFDRNAREDMPTAHLHVHSYRDAATWALTRSGSRSRRSRRRQKSGVPSLKELHFPLGGKRFRPPLEDVLQFLVEEFGVDAADNWRIGLADGRAAWRRTQIRAAARDAPEEAAALLREIGYTVVSPTKIPAENSALRQY